MFRVSANFLSVVARSTNSIQQINQKHISVSGNQTWVRFWFSLIFTISLNYRHKNLEINWFQFATISHTTFKAYGNTEHNVVLRQLLINFDESLVVLLPQKQVIKQSVHHQLLFLRRVEITGQVNGPARKYFLEEIIKKTTKTCFLMHLIKFGRTISFTKGSIFLST